MQLEWIRQVVIHSLCNTQKNLIPKQYNHIYIDIGDYFYLCFLDSFAKYTTLELFQWEFVARVLAQLFQIPFCFIQGNAHPGKWPANSGEESWAWWNVPIIPALSGVERKDSETKSWIESQPGSHCSLKNTSRVGVEGKGMDKSQHPKRASPAVDLALTPLTQKVQQAADGFLWLPHFMKR